MFEDFASSGRGPGLVGIVLAFLVLAGFGGMAVGVFYDEGPAGNSLENKVAEGKIDIEQKKQSLVEMEEKLNHFKDLQKKALEVTANERNIKHGQEDLASLEQKKVEALDEIEKQKAAFVEYRQHYRLAERTAAVGEIIDLSETKGPDYKSVEILGISANLFRVRSSSGPKGIPYTELPPSVQDRFQFSEEEVAEYVKFLDKADKARREKIAAHKKQQSKKMEGRQEAGLAARAKFLEAEIEKLKAIAAKSRDLSSDYASKARIHLEDDKKARAQGKSGMHKSLAQKDHRTSQKYASQAEKAKTDADKLSVELDQVYQKISR